MKLLSCGPESAAMSVKGSQWLRPSYACLQQHQCKITPLDWGQWKASHNSADAGARRGCKALGSHAVACVINRSLTVHKRLLYHTKATRHTWTESQSTLLGMDDCQGSGGSVEGGLPKPPSLQPVLPPCMSALVGSSWAFSYLSCHLLNFAKVAAQKIYAYQSQHSVLCNLSPCRTRSKPGQSSGISLTSCPHSPTRGDWISNALCVSSLKDIIQISDTPGPGVCIRGQREGRKAHLIKDAPSCFAEAYPSGGRLKRPIFVDLSTRK